MKNIIILITVLILSLSCMCIGEKFHEEYGEEFDLYNFTENTFNFPNVFEEKTLNITDNYYTIKTNRISNILLKIIDCSGYVVMESAKFCFEYGFNHPEKNYYFWMRFIYFSVLIYISFYMGIVIFSFVYLLVLIFKVIIKRLKKIKKRYN